MFGYCVRSAVGFLREENGPTAVEYAVMLALILLALFSAVVTLGRTTSETFHHELFETMNEP